MGHLFSNRIGNRHLAPPYFEMRRIILLLLGISLAVGVRAAEPTAEARVAELVKQPGVTVVHLWATWCPNCYMEFKDGGWKKFVEANPETQIVFASVWDDGKDGRALLEKFGVGAQKNVTIVADP